MSSELFTHTEPGLLTILNELTSREPIFHRPAYPTAMAPGFWEVGASGRRYSRDFILRLLADEPPEDAEIAGWRTLDRQVRRLAHDTFLFTYTLHQGDRRSRRATIWQLTASGWQVLHHQGTLVAAEEDDVAQSQAVPQS